MKTIFTVALACMACTANGQLNFTSGSAAPTAGVSPAGSCMGCGTAGSDSSGSYNLGLERKARAWSEIADPVNGCGPVPEALGLSQIDGSTNSYSMETQTTVLYPQCFGESSATANAVATFTVGCRGRLRLIVTAFSDNNDIPASMNCTRCQKSGSVSYTISINGSVVSSSSTEGSGILFFDEDVNATDVVEISHSCSQTYNFNGPQPGQACGACDDTATGASCDIDIDFTQACLADINGDGILGPGDFNAWVDAFNNGDPIADQNCDGVVAPNDFNAWLMNFNTGC